MHTNLVHSIKIINLRMFAHMQSMTLSNRTKHIYSDAIDPHDEWWADAIVIDWSQFQIAIYVEQTFSYVAEWKSTNKKRNGMLRFHFDKCGTMCNFAAKWKRKKYIQFNLRSSLCRLYRNIRYSYLGIEINRLFLLRWFFVTSEHRIFGLFFSFSLELMLESCMHVQH